MLVGKSFVRNRAPVRASALAYTTLLALIPILAMVVSVSTSFLKKDGEKPINDLIERAVTKIAPQLGLIEQSDTDKAQQSRNEVVQRILEYIENMNSGKLGATAAIVLVFVGISLLSTIEATFNDMWGVVRGRPWSQRVVQYWAALSLGPIFLVTALTLQTLPQFSRYSEFIAEAPFLGTFVFQALPFVVLSLTLMFFYKLMPNTRVVWTAAFVGGCVGGVLLQLNSMFSVIYLSKVVSYSKVYGSMGTVPIFLVGLYFSWLIVLFGAQVGYAYQNRLAYLQEKEAESVNQQGREFVALRLMTYIAQKFEAGEKPPSRLQMSAALGVPSQLAAQIIVPLVAGKLLVEVHGEEIGYSPARPIERISIEDILCALRAGQGKELATADDPARAVVREQFERVLLAEMQVANAVNLKTLAQRATSVARSLPENGKQELTEGAAAAA